MATRRSQLLQTSGCQKGPTTARHQEGLFGTLCTTHHASFIISVLALANAVTQFCADSRLLVVSIHEDQEKGSAYPSPPLPLTLTLTQPYHPYPYTTLRTVQGCFEFTAPTRTLASTPICSNPHRFVLDNDNGNEIEPQLEPEA